MTQTMLQLGGATLVAVAFLDAFATTLSVGTGAGPLTHGLMRVSWSLLVTLSRHVRLPLLTLAGPLILVGTVVMWTTLLWAGWCLVFSAGQPAVISASTHQPASVVQLIYFTGFTVFTLGIGDFIPVSDGWRVATSVASFTGLFLVTLAITYLLSAASAVVAKRSFAISVHGLGQEAAQFVATGWNGREFSSAFIQHLVTLSFQLGTVAEQHLAYPVMHHFRTSDRITSTPIAVSVLGDAVVLLDSVVAPDARPDSSATAPLRAAVASYLANSPTQETLQDPEAPDITPLRAAGVPVVDEAQLRRALEEHAKTRRKLRAAVKAAGWAPEAD